MRWDLFLPGKKVKYDKGGDKQVISPSDGDNHEMILDLEAKPDFDSDDEAVIKMKKSAYRRSQDHIAEMLAAEVDGDDEEGDVTMTPVDKD